MLYHHDCVISLLNRHLLSSDQCINTFLPRTLSCYLTDVMLGREVCGAVSS